MNIKLPSVFCALAAGLLSLDGIAAFEMDRSVMSEAYWKIWNDAEQARIDADIEANRKADGVFALDGVPAGTSVKVDQVESAFKFGAHIFNYNQLGTPERNARYRELYGTLFNRATVAFYWKTMEPLPGKVRYEEAYEDTEEFWNAQEEPWKQPHWRRPPPDPVINYLRARRVQIHGHPLCWGDNGWHTPAWLWDWGCPLSEKIALERATGEKINGWDGRTTLGTKLDFNRFAWEDTWRRIHKKLTPEQVAQLVPTYLKNFNDHTFTRARQIAERYGNVVDSWDIVNETSPDFKGTSVTGAPYTPSPRYGVMASDLAYNAFKSVQDILPKTAMLNINDYEKKENYIAQVKDLLKHGARVDVVGSQMHLFNPKESEAVARGEGSWEIRPQFVRDWFGRLSSIGLPIVLSEITITAPDKTPRGEMVQAIILWNMYRAWFAQKNMAAITWWNVVDDCGAPGEPSLSGLFTRDMKPKAAYYAMDELINHAWRTHTTATTDAAGTIRFRGFKGVYRLTWKDANGVEQTKEVDLK